MTNQSYVVQAAVQVNGSDLSQVNMDKLMSVEVDTSLYVPSMFVIRFYDDDLSLVDTTTFAIGGSVTIKLSNGETPTLTSVMDGEITSIEPEFSETLSTILTIRGYDKAHRLSRGTKTAVYKDSTDSDIASKIAGAAGLSIEADSTSSVHEHVFQHNQTDFAFLRQRAHLNGFELLFQDSKLHFSKVSAGTAINLKWGTELRSFHPRLSVVEQVATTKVRGWDMTQKQPLVSTAATSNMAPQIGFSGTPQSNAKAFSSSPEFVEVHQPITNQSEGDTLAKALLDEISSGFVEAEGVAFGTPALIAGKSVKISNVGTNFSGTYFVTSATHYFCPATGYDTHFEVEGVQRRLTADLVTGGAGSSGLLGGVFPAIVTNNNDDKNMGRVKLKYPWLDPDSESNWARICMVGGGNTRGIFWLPEVNDEVLVAFEHGDFNFPYVIGGLYNGTDAPPATSSTAVMDGKVATRIIQTKKHIITLTESSSSELIELKDQGGKTLIRMTSAPSAKIEITCQTDVNVTGMNVTVHANGAAKVTAPNITVQADAQLDLKGAIVNVESEGPLKLKGAIVNIN